MMQHMRPRFALALTAQWVVAAALCACNDQRTAARAQWVIEVQTDALVPLVGDRVLIELLDDAGELACSSCRRDATAARSNATADHPSDWPVTFGVEATARAIYLRTRLYRADHVKPETGQPDPRTCIDNLALLPTIRDQVVKVFVGLRLECLGKEATLPSDAGSSFATWNYVTSAMIPPPLADTTSPGLVVNNNALVKVVRTECVAPANPDKMACVPGGYFFLGSSLAPVPHSGVEAAPIPERFVGIHSFLMDRAEVTVSEFAEWVTAAGIAPCDAKKKIRCTDPNSQLQTHCKFPPGTPPYPTDLNAPMNCVSWDMARDYCAWNKGKRLPTETEWEYAASNGGRDTRFSWGEDSPNCAVAVLARDFKTGGPASDVTACITALLPAGPEDLTSGFLENLRDRTMVAPNSGGTEVLDLAGNVAEWTSDAFDTYGTGTWCWIDTASIVRVDPRCPPRDNKEDRSVRGGSWREPLQGAWSVNRARLRPVPVLPSPDVGFRCVCDLDLKTRDCRVP